MPALMRPRSATAKLSWSSSRPASPSSKPAQRPASARYMPRGRTTKTELDKLLEEAEQGADPPPPPPKPVTDAEKMKQQRTEWMAKDAAFRRAAEEKERQHEREQQRMSSVEQQEAEQAKGKAAADAEHSNAVQARLHRLGLAGAGKAKARLRSSVLKAKDMGEDARALTQAEAQHRDTLKVLSSFHTGTYDEIERQVDCHFDTFNEIATSAPNALGDAARAPPVTDADFDLGLENAKHGVGDQVHADMFVKLHELWASTRDEIPTEESKAENVRVRAMVVARFRRYQQTWPKSERDLEAITIAQYTAGTKQRQAGKRRRPQSGPARPTAEQQRSEDRASRRPTKESRPASGPARVGWSAEADAYVARIGLFPPRSRPPSAQPIRSAGQWAQRLHMQQQMTRPVSAPARLAATVVARWSHHTLGYALRGWRDAATWRAAARARLRYCVNRMLDDRLYRCIDRWREQASLQRRAKQLLRRTVVTWNNQSLAFAFNSWKEYLAAVANRYGGILAMWKGDGRRMYFNMWKQAVALIKEQKPASREFFQGLGLATFRGIEMVPEVWKVGQAALHSDSDDSSDSGGEREMETPDTRTVQKESNARKKKQREAAEQGQQIRELPRGPGRRGLNSRLLRYYYDSNNVANHGTDRTMGDQCSAAACAQDAPLAWSQLEISAVNSRPARVPTTQALTHKPPVQPSPHDIVTAALEGRLRNHHDTAGVSLGYLGPVAVGKRLPRNVYDKELERETVLSEKPEPEREVELRATELYGKTDELGRLHYEGQYISHAYRPSVSRANNRRGAVSNRVVESCMDAAAAAAAAVAALAVEVRTGVSADQAAAARARKQRLAKEREYGWQIPPEKLDKSRLITHPKRRGRGAAADKKKHSHSLWHSTRAASTSVCVIC